MPVYKTELRRRLLRGEEVNAAEVGVKTFVVDGGYIEEPKPVHEHKYELHVQDFEADKYFVALRVCICGDSKAGELNIILTNAAGETVQLILNKYGQMICAPDGGSEEGEST